MNYFKDVFLGFSKCLFVLATPVFIFDASPKDLMTDLVMIVYLIISLVLGVHYLIKAIKQNAKRSKNE